MASLIHLISKTTFKIFSFCVRMTLASHDRLHSTYLKTEQLAVGAAVQINFIS